MIQGYNFSTLQEAWQNVRARCGEEATVSTTFSTGEKL